jgi:anti-sigma regulatory factor (Ser/Thr protein kinase)
LSEAVLDFSAVDGIGFAAARGRLDAIPQNVIFRAADLGPLLEILHLQECGLVPRNPRWLDLGSLGGAYEQVAQRRPRLQSDCVEFRTMGLERTASTNAWTAFAMAAKRSAIQAGFDADFAAQMIAALRELEDNVREHAEKIEGAYLAYRQAPQVFEFVVADHGAGVLASLRRSREYSGLATDGEALRTALTEGVSRFGRQAARGFGYRPLFTGLVNRRAFLRFRTGSGSLVMDGVTLGLPSAQIGVKPRLDGLFISIRAQVG